MAIEINPTVVKMAADSKFSVADRVRLYLQKSGEREVYFDLDAFAAEIHAEPFDIYQTMYRFQRNGELEILTEQRGDGRRKVIGAKLNKLSDPKMIIRRVTSDPTQRIVKRSLNKIQERLPNLLAYRTKKETLDKIRSQLEEAGFEPNEVLVLPSESQIAEEGLIAYDELLEAYRRIAEMEIQTELSKRISHPEDASDDNAASS